jgi:hypothetical protein
MHVIFKRCFHSDTAPRNRVLCDHRTNKPRLFPTEAAAWEVAATLNPGKLDVLRVSDLDASQVAMAAVMASCPALRFVS